ncbi:NADH dehydrogenase [ubiquinone] 1 alpha subcomplex subunit 2 [Biomphalaria glabrata]|uniref:NADH dehydrogenase [ubiquinone] 1 alpha subcomplex subunit 2 n=1 Tax=Biomphalaria glabrata TaxID=6526 RepID=A0A2C9LUV0_BIOGL|nr:NADH dehydrogenase [ubiquinone] 1 alpha subcomplex subunit 2-like [Biomphalaria glabrata]KAI8757191.1 NADH dehydrogenase [ubiquinone] 1 alpha subcomplex subunit 2-like [Biomphalaria glabrata]KAI8798651.1 NADH dehydrogenase [ubiquinone] 1 alpha subcomplex subunit 2 [Biomphalaria glabrata]
MASTAIKIGSHLKELRFHLCLKSASSKGIREYLESNYVGLKKQNPKFPFLVREALNVQPKVYARYELGKESSLPLTNMTKEQVSRAVESLIASSKSQH